MGNRAAKSDSQSTAAKYKKADRRPNVRRRRSKDRSWKTEAEKATFYLLTSTVYLLTFSSSAQSLENYQRTAAENNPGLQAQYQAFEAALEKVPQARSLSDPTLSFGYFVSPVETRVGPQRARLSLNQMFPWFGTLKARSNVASLNAEAQYQAFLNEKNRLFYQVAVAYYPLYELNQWLILERENTEILESFKTIATSKFENAEGTLVDVLRVDLMLKDAVTTIKILEEKRQPLVSVFNKLLNQDESTPVQTPDTLTVSEEVLNFSKDSLSTTNPVVEEISLKIKASEAQAVLAEKQRMPQLGVGLDYVVVGPREDLAPGMSVPDNGQDVLMPMASLSLPIYQGKYRAAQRDAQLMQQSYSLQKEAAINDLITNYEMTAFDRSQQRQLIALYQEQIAQTRQMLNLLLTAYSNSGSAFEEVLGVQQQLLTYQKTKATALIKYHIALAKLDYLTAKNY